MRLEAYKRELGVSYKSIAAACGVTPQRISQIAHGHYKPSWRLAGAIALATGGRVERAQWFPDDAHCGVISTVRTKQAQHAADTLSYKHEAADTVSARSQQGEAS
jgi:DNA-binding XRE family transcriptional regulator